MRCSDARAMAGAEGFTETADPTDASARSSAKATAARRRESSRSARPMDTPPRDDLSVPYVQATADLRCVDDPHSEHYNRIVSTADTEIDWKSAERMRRDDDLYVLALVVEHNTKTTWRVAGSCIFLHLWEGPDKGMSGCTAMSRDALEELAAWLDRDAAVLVALPLGEYELFRRPWRLPISAKPAFRSRAEAEAATPPSPLNQGVPAKVSGR